MSKEPTEYEIRYYDDQKKEANGLIRTSFTRDLTGCILDDLSGFKKDNRNCDGFVVIIKEDKDDG